MAIARYPTTVLDCADPGALSRFYAAMLDWTVVEDADDAGAWFEAPSEKGPVRVKALLSQVAEGEGKPGAVLQGLTVACGEGALRLTRLQLPGGKPLSFADLYNSRREQFAPGLVLEQ